MKRLLVLGLLVGGGMSVYGMTFEESAEYYVKTLVEEASSQGKDVNQVLQSSLRKLPGDTSRPPELRVLIIHHIMKQHPQPFESEAEYCSFLIDLASDDSVQVSILQAALVQDLSDERCTLLECELERKFDGDSHIADDEKITLLKRYISHIKQRRQLLEGDRLSEETTTLFGRIIGGAGVLVVLGGLYYYLREELI